MFISIHRIISFIRPPVQWLVAVLIAGGIGMGLVAYLFYISKAHSYLSDSPKTCMNCHIMAPQYATWQHSSHRENATCNDCHVPHDNFFSTYRFKASDGMRHATIFTLRHEPQVIFIREEGAKVVQQNCIDCHQSLIATVKLTTQARQHDAATDRLCWDCHREVPHGRVHSLSSVPYARVPVAESPVPKWLKEMLKK